MNFIKNNFKHILMASSLFLFLLVLGLGLGLSAYGMGVESQRFISSIDRTINKYIPKGKVVLDGKAPVYDVIGSLLKISYENDVLSTLTDEQNSNSATKKVYREYADAKFDQRWKATIDNKEDIDINEFSHALVQFDIQVAKEFHNYGFTHSGLQWTVQKGVLSQLWSLDYSKTKIYQEAEQNQIIINQLDYKTGTYLVNNKVWFINDQIKTLVASLELNVFKDNQSVRNTLITKDKDDKDVLIQISIDDLYHPNYTNSFQQTRIGSIFLIILTPIFGMIFVLGTLVSYYYFQGKLK